MIAVVACHCGSSDSLVRNFLKRIGYKDWLSIPVEKGREKSLSVVNQLPPVPEKEMLKNLLKNASKKDDVVLDCFGGSGSTLIACEQLGRKCYMMELDPKYCDVIRKRYWKFVTGSEEGWQDGTKAI